jgi:thiol-disulfide isomerase/thioredoxin
MKKEIIVFSLLVSLLFVISSDAYSQSGKIPPFRIVQANDKVFKAENLPVGKPIVIIYFSPDCEECLKLTEDLLKRLNDFKKASITMVTYLPVEYVKQFVKKYNLNIYPNIYVGTEGNSFIIRYYYNIQTFPFMALYNKNGDLIKSYYKEDNLEDLSLRLRDL